MKLRDYQEKIVKRSEQFIDSDGHRAQIYAPPGSGKTVCFVETIKYAINKGMTNIAIVHPRLALSTDQLKRIKPSTGTNVRTTSFHSGAHWNGEETIGEISTVNPDELKRVIDGTLALQMPHITFTTYHSYSKLITAKIEFDLVVCDEAHYLVNDQFIPIVENIIAKKVMFYTATPITESYDEHLGKYLGKMADTDLFGDIIAEVEPRRLIRNGFLIAPLIHRMECTPNGSKAADIVDITTRAYAEQWRRVTGWGQPGHKMLVVARDVRDDMTDGIEQNIASIQWAIEVETGAQNVPIYTISSKGAFRNGRVFNGTRADALAMIDCKETNAIVVHYDTLSEGIDINTLGGVVIMRQLSKPKFIQNMCRAARPLVTDLDSVGQPQAGLYDPEAAIDLRKKPRFILTVPVVNGEIYAGPRYKDIADAFAEGGYGDITDFIPYIESTPTGRTQEFDLSDDESIEFAQIVNHFIIEEGYDIFREVA